MLKTSAAILHDADYLLAWNQKIANDGSWSTPSHEFVIDNPTNEVLLKFCKESREGQVCTRETSVAGFLSYRVKPEESTQPPDDQTQPVLSCGVPNGWNSFKSGVNELQDWASGTVSKTVQDGQASVVYEQSGQCVWEQFQLISNKAWVSTSYVSVEPWKKLNGLPKNETIPLTGKFNITINLNALPNIPQGWNVQYLLYKSNGSQDLKLFFANENYTDGKTKLCLQKESNTVTSSNCVTKSLSINITRDSVGNIKINNQPIGHTITGDISWDLWFWALWIWSGLVKINQNMDIVFKN